MHQGNNSSWKSCFFQVETFFTFNLWIYRYSGLVPDLFTTISKTTPISEIEKYNYNKPPENKPMDRSLLWDQLKKNPYLREAGRMFGVFRINPV